MSTSERVSRGFHRLELFLAAIPLLAGGVFATYLAVDTANITPLVRGLPITLAVTLAVYGVVRAIGWVIGGFAAS
jgi:hypothetical protein